MNKRFMAFLLAALLMFSAGGEAALAVTLPEKAPKEATKEKESAKNNGEEIGTDNYVSISGTTGDLDKESVTISENSLEKVTISENTTYKVFKFVPETTNTYHIFSDGDFDTYVCLYEKNVGDTEGYSCVDEDDDNDAGNGIVTHGTNFGLSRELTAQKEYYYIVSGYHQHTTGTFDVLLSSSYTSMKDYALDNEGGIKSVSFNSATLPKHEWYEFEDVDLISAYMDESVTQIEYTVEFNSGKKVTEKVSEWTSFSEGTTKVGHKLFVFDKVYLIYWEHIKYKTVTGEDGEEYVFYMDESKANSLCIEDEAGNVEKYPVVTNIKNPVASIKIVKNPYETDKELYIRDLTDICLNNGWKIQVNYMDENQASREIFDYDEDGNYNSEWSEISYTLKETNSDATGYKLGENSLVFSYFGQKAEVPVEVYTDAGIDVLTPITCTYDGYPYNVLYDIVNLKGLKVKIHYTNGKSEEITVTEDVNYIDNSLGYRYWSSIKDNGDIMINNIAVGKFTCSKTMDSIPGIKNITPGVSENVVLDVEKGYGYFSFTPDETREYVFYSSDNTGAYECDPCGYICTNNAPVAQNDDDDELNFKMTQELKAGETYYFVVRVLNDNGGTFNCNLKAVRQFDQTIKAPASMKKTVGDGPFSIGATAYGKVKMSYATGNPAVATVDANGKVTIKGAGTTTITITTEESNEYKAGTKTITLTVTELSGGYQPQTQPQPQPNTQKLTIQAKSSYKKTYGSKSFKLNAKSEGVLTYKTSNSKVATVNKSGKVTIKKCGKAVITVKATKQGYTTATKKITIKVVPKQAKITSVKSSKAGQLTVKWKKRSEAKGYIIQYSTDKNFKKNVKEVKITKNKTTSKTIKKLKKGKKYYVRVKAYVTIDKKAATGSVSKARSKKVKK